MDPKISLSANRLFIENKSTNVKQLSIFENSTAGYYQQEQQRQVL